MRRRATIANPAIECSAWLAMRLRQLSVAVQPTHARMGARTARQLPSLSRRLARAREAATSFRPGRRPGQSAVLPVSCHFAAGEARRRQSRILGAMRFGISTPHDLRAGVGESPAEVDSSSEETTVGGDPACWAHLICPECGAVISEGHQAGCPAAVALNPTGY